MGEMQRYKLRRRRSWDWQPDHPPSILNSEPCRGLSRRHHLRMGEMQRYKFRQHRSWDWQPDHPPSILNSEPCRGSSRRHHLPMGEMQRMEMAADKGSFSSTSPITLLLGGSCLLNPVKTEAGGSFTLFPDAVLVSDLVRVGVIRSPKLLLSGWGAPTMGWKDWVTVMSRHHRFVKVWREAGIEDALMASLNDITPDPQVIGALSGFWCSSTCTFIFPWGEASFTLEDAHLLSNLPLRGSGLERSLTAEEEELWSRLVVEKEKIWELHPKAKLQGRISNEIWIDWFTCLDGEDQLKHLGFLAYWLSSHVFPSKPAGEISPIVFKLAARLYKGDRIALAPAITASIYSNLSTITTSVRNYVGRKKACKIDAWAQFGLLQTWVWERFKSLRPRTQGIMLSESCVRTTRWSGGHRLTCYDEAVEVFRDDKSFTWKPYSEPLNNWKQPKWYSLKFQKIVTANMTPSWVYDFLAIISSTSLEGFSSDGRIIFESYSPHRVGMQLGYDQAIPELWNSQGLSCGTKPIGVQFHMVGIEKSGIRRKDYEDWWKEYMSWYMKSLDEYIVQGENNQGKSKMRKKEKERLPGQSHAFNQGSDLMALNNEMHKRVCEMRKVELVKTSDRGSREATDCPAGHTAFAKVQEDSILKIANYKVPSIYGESSRTLVAEVVDGLGEEVMRVPWGQKNTSLPQEEENKEKLLKELEEFECNRLVMEWAPSSPKMGDSNEINWENKMVFADEDPYGHEAMRMFPQFFKLIPQRPHYRGLLKGNVAEGVRRDICTSLWFRLVYLMKKVLSSSCLSNTLEVDELLREARYFEQLGFDVRHLNARLKEMQSQPRNQRKLYPA